MGLVVYAGTELHTTATFAVGGKAADPSSVTLKWRNGKDGVINVWTVTTGEIVHVGVGVYEAFIPTTAGQGTVEWIGTGTAAVVEVETFKASSPPL